MIILCNPFNPNNPPQDVFAGEATTDEMMITFFTFSLYFQGDENIVIDTSSHVQHYNYCELLTHSENEVSNTHSLLTNVYPNPVQNLTHVLSSVPMDKIELFDIQGRKLGLWDAKGQKAFSLDLAWLPSGCYFFQVYYSNQTFETVQLMKE